MLIYPRDGPGSGFDKEFAVNSRGVLDDRREEFRRPVKNEEKSVKRKLRCTRRHGPQAEGAAVISATLWK
ncbi:MAG: hypothetical protein EOM61_08875 [Bacteroidia bacterium]|nr:hypothetical protein [Rikenellaceae bacterium]NCB19717.1 hypothetical protein [Bacteroidia bacterium]